MPSRPAGAPDQEFIERTTDHRELYIVRIIVVAARAGPVHDIADLEIANGFAALRAAANDCAHLPKMVRRSS
jgi:hypothetical protein